MVDGADTSEAWSFAKHIANFEPRQPVLPGAHLTTFSQFIEIVRARQIGDSSRCPAGRRSACYFFYGAPFYLLPNRREHKLTIEELHEHGVGLLVDASVFDAVEAEVYPFDTGAQRRGLFAPHVDDSDASREQFRVPTRNAPHTAARLVECIFGSNAAYLSGYDVRADQHDGLIPLKRLRNAKIAADFRRQGIEIVSLGPVRWRTSRIVLIVPKTYVARQRRALPELDAFLSDPGAVVITYHDHVPFGPESDSRAILEKAIDWLEGQWPEETTS